MGNRLTIAAIVLAVIIGPILFVFARTQALHAAFERVSNGDTVPVVRKAMGAPTGEASAHLYLKAETEYRYSVWPLPTVWVVGFVGGKVVDKSELQSP
ncbi:MAG: hypothetical protein ABI640_14420 [Gammaproteobacteria bacterium]